jgi:hypothetical protein
VHISLIYALFLVIFNSLALALVLVFGFWFLVWGVAMAVTAPIWVKNEIKLVLW